MELRLVFEDRWRVLSVCGRRGEDTFMDFLESLQKDMGGNRATLMSNLEHASKSGPTRRSDISHNIAKKVFQFTAGPLRVPYFYDEGRIIILTHCFIKDSKKTPRKHIRRAVRAREKYFRAKKEGSLHIIEED